MNTRCTSFLIVKREVLLAVALAGALGSGCLGAGTNSEELYGDGVLTTPAKTDANANEGDFDGCKTGVAQSASAIKLTFEMPANADKISIYRDGTMLASYTNSNKLEFLDVGLEDGKEYQYVCEASISGVAQKGRIKPKVTTLTIDAFKGCVSGTALGVDSVSLALSFLPESDKIVVYRDGVALFNSNDAKLTTFTDTGLKEATLYKYTCEAIVAGITKKGTADIKVTTASQPPFDGCKTATAVDSATITLSYQIPIGATKLNVYRDGNYLTAAVNGTPSTAITGTYTDIGL
ncbi:MAG: hypothetical protein AAB425_11935, partial [Bdellovibrionota bacterium]